MKNIEHGDCVVHTFTEGGRFEFLWRTVDREAGTGVSSLQQAKSRTRHIARDRLIQRYLEIHHFDVTLFALPAFLKVADSKDPDKIRVKRVDAVWLFPSHEDRLAKTIVTLAKQGTMSLGALGHITIYAKEIYSYVARALPDTKARMSIKEASERVWPNLSRNMQGVLHTWLRREVFRPEVYRSRPDPRGCELSASDQTLVGIMYSLFSFGCHFELFSGPSKFEVEELGESSEPNDHDKSV